MTSSINIVNDLVTSLVLLLYPAAKSMSLAALNLAQTQVVRILTTPSDDWVDVVDDRLPPENANVVAIKTTAGRIRLTYARTLRQHHMGETKVAVLWLPLPDVT